jgi:ribosomal protein L16 Arg81 hydroxylase
MPSSNLDDVLTPLPPADFIKDYWGQKFLHLPGPQGRFSSLFPWSVVNEMLETHRFVPPRLRLTHDGKAISPDLFMKNGHLQAAELTRLLRDGATLIVASVDEVYAPLKAFAQQLGRTLQARINVNLYAGWRTSHGFDVHWDNHDVFILQIAGKKQWKIWAATDKYPTKDSVELGKTPPTSAPLWDALLADGEVLYLPRGWWHVAIPIDEPTLHLTVGIFKPTGTDIVRWVADGFENDERMAMDVPLLGGAAAQAAYITRIREAIREAIDRPDLLARYTQSWNDNAMARPYFTLPWSATPEVLPESEESIITLTTPRALEIRPREDGAVDIAVNSKLFTFAGAARPILDYFGTELPASISQFYQRFAGQYERETLRQFLTEMAKHGVVTVRQPTPGRQKRSTRAGA